MSRARFKPVKNWKSVLLHSWSIRLSLIAGLFGTAEWVVDFFAEHPPLPRGTFAAIAVAIKLGSVGARLVKQVAVSGEDE